MNRDYQQDPDQDPYMRRDRDQYGQPQQDPYQQGRDPYGQDPYMREREQYGQPQDQYPMPDQPQAPQGRFSSMRRMAEQQIGQVVDQLGNKIPGGSQYTQQAKSTIGGVFDTLEREMEKRFGQ